MSTLKTRKPNWSVAETTILTEECTENYQDIHGKFSLGLSHTTKDEFWVQVMKKIQSVSGVERTVEDGMKKWRDLKSQTKKKEQVRRKELKRTGGGECVSHLKDWEEKIVSILPSQVIEGIDGGVDTCQDEISSFTTGQETVTVINEDTSLLHPTNISIQVVEEEKDIDIQPQIKKKRTAADLIEAQVKYFEEASKNAVYKRRCLIQKEKTLRLQEQYYRHVLNEPKERDVEQ